MLSGALPVENSLKAIASASVSEPTANNDGAPIEICNARAPIIRALSNRVYFNQRLERRQHRTARYKVSAGPYLGPQRKGIEPTSRRVGL